MHTERVLVDYSTNVYTDGQLVTETMSIEGSLEGNASYPTPSPTIAAITTARTEFQVALAAAHNGNVTQTATKNEKRKVLEGLLHILGPYVQLTSGGVKSVILSSGMHVAAPTGSVGEFGVVSDFKVLTLEAKNKVLMSCKAVPKALFYEGAYTLAPATDASEWKTVTGTTHEIVITGLPSFVPYEFKMAACGTNKERNYSTPITRAAG